MLKSDQRCITVFNPDRTVLQSLNLGKLIESPDCEEKELGIAISLLLMDRIPQTVLSDIIGSQDAQIHVGTRGPVGTHCHNPNDVGFASWSGPNHAV